MNALTVPRTVAGLQYKVLRLPATVLQSQVVGRLDTESPARLAFEKALGSLDTAIGKLLADDQLARRGTALSRRAQVLETAVALEDKADQRQAAAAAELERSKSAAAEQRSAAEQDKTAEVRRLRAQETAAKKAVAQKAAAQEKAAAKAVDAKAKAELAAERERLASQEAAIEQRTAERTAAPAAQLAGAVERQQEADAGRASADRLAELADAEKDSRTAEK